MRTLKPSVPFGLLLATAVGVSACDGPPPIPSEPSAAVAPTAVELSPVTRTATPTVTAVRDDGRRGSERRTPALTAVSSTTNRIEVSPVAR